MIGQASYNVFDGLERRPDYGLILCVNFSMHSVLHQSSLYKELMRPEFTGEHMLLL